MWVYVLGFACTPLTGKDGEKPYYRLKYDVFQRIFSVDLAISR